MAKIIGCTWLLQNRSGKFLMMLRDEKSGIPYPGHWVFPGGTTEGDETPEEASVRELKEELNYNSPPMEKILSLYYPKREAEEHFYYVPLFCRKEDLILGEGQMIELFWLDEIEKLKLGFWCREVIPILRRYCIYKCLFRKDDRVVPIQDSADSWPSGWAKSVTKTDRLFIKNVFFHKFVGRWVLEFEGIGGNYLAEKFTLAD